MSASLKLNKELTGGKKLYPMIEIWNLQRVIEGNIAAALDKDVKRKGN